MTLTKNKMVREIGRRTRLKNHDVQAMLEALVEVWTEELVSGGRVELENFFVLETQTINRGKYHGTLRQGTNTYVPPQYIRRLTLRVSKNLKSRLKNSGEPTIG